MGDTVMLAGSAIAVTLLVLLSIRFGWRGPPALAGSDEALAIADTLSGGFDAADVALDQAGRAALLADTKDRMALVLAHGAHFVARPLGPGTRCWAEGEELVVAVDGKAVRLALGDRREYWLARVAAIAA